MRKTKTLLVSMSFALTALAGCAGMPTEQRSVMCPECTDEQWRNINNPTPAERVERERRYKQYQNQQATSRSNAARREEALKRQKIERLRRCKQERNLLKEKDQTWIALVCKKYIETGSY